MLPLRPHQGWRDYSNLLLRGAISTSDNTLIGNSKFNTKRTVTNTVLLYNTYTDVISYHILR